ncbi:hypothetical protein [Nocardia rhizosphaerae]|uniref:Uncharacterized protein n=1 Tax=Nocardia rhizosphaerae TaxID=1691571 RepID=A0ABV8LAQ0_9NOCA
MDERTKWLTLAGQAMSGELRIEPGVGEAIRKAAKQYAEDLEILVGEAQRLGYLSGWGGLDSAKLLRVKFEQKAVGGGDDPTDNAVSRLQEHIAIAWLQHDTFAAAIGKLEMVDEERAAAIRAAAQGI